MFTFLSKLFPRRVVWEELKLGGYYLFRPSNGDPVVRGKLVTLLQSCATLETAWGVVIVKHGTGLFKERR